MNADPDASTARRAKVAEHATDPGAAESKGQLGTRAEGSEEQSTATVAPEAGENLNESGAVAHEPEPKALSDRSGQSHQRYMALVSKSGDTKSTDRSDAPAEDNLPADQPTETGQSASIAQIGGG